MAFNYEYPYTDTNRYNSDWLLNKMKELCTEFASFKKEIKKYVDLHLEDILDDFVYDISYDAATETIYYIRREENTNG